jgi:peptidoglycan/xylan/chitin deacetylase (PgdA/CDA1 family)
VLGVIEALGYRDIGADVVLDDWEPQRTGPLLHADALRLTREIGDGAVVLFHAWPPGTGDAIAPLIRDLRAAGADFVRIDELERFSGSTTADGLAGRLEVARGAATASS